MNANVKERTIADFGDQWTTYQENPGAYGDKETLADVFGPLMSLDEVSGTKVVDIGSGSGRIVNMLLDSGAAHVTAVEPSAAMSVVKQNTAARAAQISYLQIPGDELPPNLGVDLAVSIGVIHHIPEPAPVIKAMHDALRPGGKLLIWLYGSEGNRLYLSFALPLRVMSQRMPDKMLWGFSAFLSWLLSGYIALCRVIPFLPMRSYMRNVVGKWTQEVRKVTIYDQLNPAYAKYYSRKEAIVLAEAGGFTDVQVYHRHGYSWTVRGTKLANRAVQ